MSQENDSANVIAPREGEDNYYDIQDLYHPLSKYTPEQKFEAMAYYLVLGTSPKVSKITGIPAATIRQWKALSPWWGENINKMKKAKQDELDARLTSIIHDSLEELEDRVKNGDEVIGKDGAKQRRKMSGREIALTMAILYDKRALMRGEPTSHQQKTDFKSLEAMKDAFEKLSDEIQQRNEKVIEGNVVDEEE